MLGCPLHSPCWAPKPPLAPHNGLHHMFYVQVHVCVTCLCVSLLVCVIAGHIPFLLSWGLGMGGGIALAREEEKTEVSW
jgi:hypothetical protein